MKTALLFILPLAGVSAFGVTSPTRTDSRTTTALFGRIADSDLRPEQKEIRSISDKWNEVRHLSRDEAEKLSDPKWLEAYNRYFEKYQKDEAYMTEISQKLASMLEPPRIKKKSEAQRKRDKWAKIQAREAARAATKK